MSPPHHEALGVAPPCPAVAIRSPVWQAAFDHRVDSRVESFCTEKAGHDDGLWAQQHFLGDQGMTFFTNNATWGPPLYVHAMVADSWQPRVLALDASAAPPNCSLSAVAVRSDDGGTVVVRALNYGQAPLNVSIELTNGGTATAAEEDERAPPQLPPTVRLVRLAAPREDVDNPIWDPMRYSPRTSHIQSAAFGGAAVVVLPPLSFSVFTFDGVVAGEVGGAVAQPACTLPLHHGTYSSALPAAVELMIERWSGCSKGAGHRIPPSHALCPGVA